MECRDVMFFDRTANRRNRRAGYMLIATSLSLFFLLGVAGLAVDVGRMYITKSEAQAFADSAALSAAAKLDGTSTGIANATSIATSNNDKWRFDTSKFSNIGVSFSTSSNGTFVSNPASPLAYDYVQVYVSVSLPMYLIRILSGPTATVSASAVAGNTSSITTISSGVFPFSPYTRQTTYGATPDDANDPFGYKVGNIYTLRWGAPGNKTNCSQGSLTLTDNASTTEPLATNGQVRGYCCAGTSASAIGAAIVGLQTFSITIDGAVPMEPGAKDSDIRNYLPDRSGYDTDNTSEDYQTYKTNGTGNGARIVVVPVNDGNYKGTGTYTALGFATFFLGTSSDYNKLGGNDSACGEYLGQSSQGGIPYQTSSGTYKIRLYQ